MCSLCPTKRWNRNPAREGDQRRWGKAQPHEGDAYHRGNEPLAANLADIGVALKEWVGLVAYYALDRIDELFPAPTE